MAMELCLAPFPFHRSGDLFIYSRGAKKVGTEPALLFYWPVPVPIYLFTGRPATPEREPGKKNSVCNRNSYATPQLCNFLVMQSPQFCNLVYLKQS